MHKLELDKNIYDKCNEAIIITGTHRSGTTIMGKIINSCERVEYSFEPPMLFTLLPLINFLNEKDWKILYETYLYEELLVYSLAGRSINCNRIDDSSIYLVKGADEIESRLSRSLKKEKAIELALSSRIAYKMPIVGHLMPKLKKYYPGSKIVVMHRNAVDVFNSILGKGWFSSESLGKSNIKWWPFCKMKGVKVPCWIDPGDFDEWNAMDELHKTAYYYIMVNKSLKDILESILIEYDKLVADPVAETNSLFKKLNLQKGKKTDKLIANISRTNKQRDYEILSKLRPNVREEVEYYSNHF